MNQPGSAAYLAAMRRTQPETALLVQIELSVPAALTLRFSSRAIEPVDGYVWDTGVAGDAINDSCDYLGTGPNLVSWSFALVNRRLSIGGGGTRLDDLLTSYQWRGARVTAYMYAMAIGTLTGVPPCFDGYVLSAILEMDRVTVACSQSLAWNLLIPSQMIDVVNAPNAVDQSLGLPKPIILGSHAHPTLPAPFTSSELEEHDQSGGGRLAVPLLTVDPGTGANDAKLLAAGHELKDLLNLTGGKSAFVAGVGPLLAPVASAGITETLGASESYLTIDDGQLAAYAAVLPARAVTNAASVNNSADGPRFAMTPHDLSQYAEIDQTAGKNRLVLELPDVSALGTVQTVEVLVAFQPTTANPADRWRASACDVDAGLFSASPTYSGTGLTIGQLYILRGAWDAGFYSDWRFNSGGTNKNAAIVVDCETAGDGAVHKARIYWACLVVKFAPARSVVGQVRALNVSRSRPYFRKWKGPRYVPTTWNPMRELVVPGPQFDVTDTLQLDAPLFANCDGQPDDGSGTFSGVAAALIERPPDVVRWMLDVLGGLGSSDFETTAGEHGSFPDARSAVRGEWPTEFKIAPYIGQQLKLSDAIKAVCGQSLCSVFLDRFTGKWRFHVWRPGAHADYDLTFRWDIIDLVRAEPRNNLDTVHEVRTQYGYDHFTGRTLWETFVGPNGSSTGYNQRTTRDQRPVTISASNNKIDFDFSGATGPWTGMIANATYAEHIALAQAIRSAMVTASGLANTIAVGYGHDVKAGYNDSLTFTVGATPYTATRPAGRFVAGEYAARNAQDALNACGSAVTFAVTYDPVTNKMTVAASGAFDITDDGADHQGVGWATLGFPTRRTAGSSYLADVARYAEFFWWTIVDSLDHVSGHSSVKLLWGTGASAATACAPDVGFDATDTATALNVDATYARATRETVAASALSEYGPQDPDRRITDWLNDEHSAVRLRNRLFDLQTIDRVVVVFKTTWAPDLQRFRKIQFDSTLDEHVAFPRYGSDGSWVGKVFIVIGVVQYPVDGQHFSEITAIEA